MFHYSVAIRTLGTSGEKYKKLIMSIKNQTIKPDKVIVVLPDGYSVPNERGDIETFVFSKKGMVIQRLEALKYIDSEYILFCDDDIEFNEDFVKMLSEPLIEKGYDCSSGPLLEFFPPNSFKYKIASFLGGACMMIKNKEKTYTRILNTGGWSYNRGIDIKNKKFYDAESLAWTCFLIKKSALSKIKLEDELWIDRNGYAAYDDQTMFYKLYINGFKTTVVSNAIYTHNDGKTSVKNLKLEPIYARSFNHYVFWHRFLYNLSETRIEALWKKICINYYIFISKVYNRTKVIFGKETKEELKTITQAFKDAKKYTKSDEYKNLPKIKL